MIKVGVLVGLNENLAESLANARANGFESVQICTWDTESMTYELAAKVKQTIEESGVRVSTLWCGWPGGASWNFYDGPMNLGLVPEAYRYVRMEALIKGAHFTAACGITQMATHCGFIPENLNDPLYAGTLVALRRIVRDCKKLGVTFLFETGQETPVTLLRTIEDLGGENVGINFDTGNLILYGKGNPVDALDVFGKYVRDFHCKDGVYPTDGRHLGHERAMGEGKVDWPALVKKLKEIGYDGPMTIEREISGEQQAIDIKKAKDMLEALIAAD